MKSIKKVLFILVILSLIIQIVIPKAYAKGVSTIIYNGESLYEKIGNQAVLDNIRSEHVASDTGIDFTRGASNTNGQGVYTIASTANDKFPIYYYRGNVNNNNVLFGGFCWQIVRTTETGGVKLIYNGSPDDNGKCVNTKYDSDLKLSSGYGNLYMLSEFDENSISIYRKFYDYDKNYDIVNVIDSSISVSKSYGNEIVSINNNDLFSKDVVYDEDSNKYILKNSQKFNRNDVDEIKNIYPIYTCGNNNDSCENVYVIDWNDFIDNGMYIMTGFWKFGNGFTYDFITNPKILFANDVEYKDGKYILNDTINIEPYLSYEDEKLLISDENLFNGHHYFCKNFSASCNEVIYFYYNKIYNKFEYIYFNDGKTVDDIYNSYYNSTNKYNSKMKSMIDEWYANELLSYSDKLEDTVWYNDKSNVATLFNKNSPIKDDNKIKLSLKYINKNDMFTVSDKIGNGKLEYPTATITAQEAVYAGSPFAREDESSIKIFSYVEPYSYLYNNYEFYTMTPSTYLLDEYRSADVGYVISYSGVIDIERETCVVLSLDSGVAPISSGCGGSYSVRPMVSLKNNMVISKGNGTPTNPYEVEEGNTVEYVIDGDLPKGFMPPEVSSYLKGSKVRLNSLKAGDVINGYRFLGWETKDVEIENNEFEMPDKNVVLIGRFEKIIETPNTIDDIGKYITIAIFSTITLTTLLITKKKIIK